VFSIRPRTSQTSGWYSVVNHHNELICVLEFSKFKNPPLPSLRERCNRPLLLFSDGYCNRAVTLKQSTLKALVFQPENFTWGPKWPLKTFFRGQFFRKGANKLKAAVGKNASGYQEKESSLLGSMIKFNECFLKCSYSIKFLLNQILVWRIRALQENNP